MGLKPRMVAANCRRLLNIVFQVRFIQNIAYRASFFNNLRLQPEVIENVDVRGFNPIPILE